MINYERVHELVEEVREILGNGYTVLAQKVKKNNGVELVGLLIRHMDDDVAPVIYIDHDMTAYDIIETYHNNVFKSDLNIGQTLTNFESIRNNIFAKVINYTANKEMLQTLPHKIILGDLAVTYYINMDFTNISGIVQISNQLMDMWNIDIEELHYISLNNIKAKSKPAAYKLVDVLLQYMDQEDVDYLGEGSDMYVCHLDGLEFGAAFILIDGYLEGLAQTLGTDLYILPSSVHEVIVMSCLEGYTSEDLREIVRSVNSTVLEPTDFLSNDVYLYTATNNSITIA